jgi:hypothetical protein
MNRPSTMLLAALWGCQDPDADMIAARAPTDPHCITTEAGVFPDTSDPDVDYDCDGWGRQDDCDNRNTLVHPAAIEYNNGRDDDCRDGEGLYYGCGPVSRSSFLPVLPFLWLAVRARRRAR